MSIAKTYIILFFLFLACSIAVTYPIIFKMDTAIYGKFFNTDMRGGLWNLWWGKYALSHHLNYNSCPFLAAPFGLDLTDQPVSWIAIALLGGTLFFTSPLFCFNLLMFGAFVLTGIATFLLVYNLIKNKIVGILTALIFTFSPYHLNKVMEFGFFFLGNWFVLYVWAIIKVREQKTFRHVIYAAAALGLTAALNPYYGFFAFIFALGFLFFSFLYHWKWKEEIKLRLQDNLAFIIYISGVFLGGAFINAPTMILVAKNIFNHKMQMTQSLSLGYIRAFDYLFAQSARPLSYLLPASTHPIFGGFTKQMFGSIFYGRGSIEQTLFLGWMPLILAFIAFRHWRHKRLHPDKFPEYLSSQENFYIGFFIFTAWSAFIFSMPPIADFGLFKIYSPSYFTYKLLPMFRAYARFGMIVMLCVSVLAGYGLKFVLDKLKTERARIACIAIISIAIMFEFTNIPPLRVTELTKIPDVYQWLKGQPGDFIIAEYPMASVSPGEAQENYDYLYYQTMHHKRMVNGLLYGTRAFDVRKEILKVVHPETPHILGALGVRYVILHSDLYEKGKYPEAVEIIGEVPDLNKVDGYKLIKTFGPDQVFEVTAE